jgi:general stress protein 26
MQCEIKFMEKNLEGGQALIKFKKLAEDIRVCMFITQSVDTADTDHTRPMSTVEVEENGTLWFYTDVRSIKAEEVNKERIVHLVYSHPGKESFMDVWGTARIVKDQQQIKDKWSPLLKAWFPNGVDDPNIALLRVEPIKSYYWDAEAGKMMSFIKMAAAAITGKRIGEDAEGRLAI